MSKKKSVLTGFAIGSAVTAAATLLSTPKAGKEVREDIKNNVQKVKSSFSNVKREGIQLKEKFRIVSRERKEAMNQVAADEETEKEEGNK